MAIERDTAYETPEPARPLRPPGYAADRAMELEAEP